MSKRTVLIAGATGVVGHAALEHFARSGDWNVIAVSRRVPELPEGFAGRHLSLDLGDPLACSEAIASLPPVSHLVYAALYEKPGLVRGWREPDQMQLNLTMLRNLLDPLAQRAGGLQHVSLLQGTKAYGVHLHPVAVPARERSPRDAHENFYWLQEDHLREMAARHGFGFTIFRPQLVFGDALGVAMNLVPVIGAYAAVCRELGTPFAYPGGPSNILEATDARLLARALAWAADAPAARGETFNVTNGDVFVWRNVWPAIADALGAHVGEDEPRSVAEFLPAHAPVWNRVVSRHGLKPLTLPELLGESHHYADFCFGHRAREAPPPVIVSTIRLRQAGFADCIDTEQMFRDWFAALQRRRVLPPPG
ncbi:MAG TPA: NAD-dependent epimerase/dehydratase family protein [Quisquiliibacterium sp.]|nr:NAD-dependent epimerase/dehydratase family protein [Quisquiliibacterium sp.]